MLAYIRIHYPRIIKEINAALAALDAAFDPLVAALVTPEEPERILAELEQEAQMRPLATTQNGGRQ